jgi:general secretion pathway protein D
VALIAVSGCSSSGAIGPSLATLSNNPVQSISLDALAKDRSSGSSAIALPTPGSQAIAITESGDGRMIGGSSMRHKPDNSGATVVLNLSSVPLQQAAKTVLGDLVGVNYLVDPRVDGVVTVQTTQPVTKADALELFQAALAPIGATLVENRGIYRISPADQSATGTISTGRPPQDNASASADPSATGAIPNNRSLRDDAVGGRDSAVGGNGVRIVQLKYVAATEVARVLEPMIPKGSIVQADDGRNILALKGSPGEIDGMLDTISIFDVDVMRGMSFAVVPVQTSQPEKLVDELKAVFASDKEGPLKGRVRFIANTRLSAVLVVTSQPSYLQRAQTWIRRLDGKANGAERQLHVYQVQNRPVAELAGVLQTMFQDQMKVVHPTVKNVSPRSKPVSLTAANGAPPAPDSTPQGGQNAGAPGGSGDLRSLARLLNNDPEASAADPMDTGSATTASAGEPPLKVVADDTKNSLLIMADDRDYHRVLRVIQSLDVVPSQVLIEAVIAEVDLNDDLQYGVQWALQNKYGTPTASFSGAITGGLAAAFPGFNYALNAGSVAATLSALNSLTHVNVLSTPSLMVLDNRTARLQVGDQVPITTQSATSTVTATTAIVNSITMQDTGVILSVTPRINESGRVQLEIEQEVSNVVGTTTSTINSPTIQQRKVKTTVVVNNGEVVALGGMIQETTSKTSTQIPLLGSIPGIGAMFSNKDNSVQKTELLILITPRIVRDGSENRQVTEEYRRKFDEAYLPRKSTREQTPANTVQRLTGQ